MVAHRDAVLNSGSATADMSGTAVLLGLERVLSGETLNRSVLLISTSGQIGAAGATQIARSLSGQPVDAVIVLGDLAGARPPPAGCGLLVRQRQADAADAAQHAGEVRHPADRDRHTTDGTCGPVCAARLPVLRHRAGRPSSRPGYRPCCSQCQVTPSRLRIRSLRRGPGSRTWGRRCCARSTRSIRGRRCRLRVPT